MQNPRDWMRRAVDLAKLSQAEVRSDPPPQVGVVIVRGDQILGDGYRGKISPGSHAEYGVLESLAGTDISGAHVFTTLEPCSRRSPPKRPCAERLAEVGVECVWIGMYDPNPKIYREGWRILRDAGVILRDFDADLRSEIAADNVKFLEMFRTSRLDVGTQSFDFLANSGLYDIEARGETFTTKWSTANSDSVHAYGDHNPVAHVRYAKSFDEIDDPAALDFSSRAHLVKEGEIVAFRSGRFYLLVQVLEVHAGQRWGADRTELKIRWQVAAPPF